MKRVVKGSSDCTTNVTNLKPGIDEQGLTFDQKMRTVKFLLERDWLLGLKVDRPSLSNLFKYKELPEYMNSFLTEEALVCEGIPGAIG